MSAVADPTTNSAAVAIAAADLVPVAITPGESDVVEAQRTVGYVNSMSRSTRGPRRQCGGAASGRGEAERVRPPAVAVRGRMVGMVVLANVKMAERLRRPGRLTALPPMVIDPSPGHLGGGPHRVHIVIGLPPRIAPARMPIGLHGLFWWLVIGRSCGPHSHDGAARQ